VRRRQRDARPGDEFVGLVEQPLRRAPECEVDGAALFFVVEGWRGSGQAGAKRVILAWEQGIS